MGRRRGGRPTSIRPTPTTSSATTCAAPGGRRAGDRRGEGGVPGVVALRHPAAPRHPARRPRTRSSRGARSSAGCSRARRARRSPTASARRCAPGRSSTSSPASACASPAKSCRASGPGIDVTMTREPVGVVGIITPWNFPIAIPAWKIAPALCYGNTVVFKPADLVPASTWAIVDILVRAGLPKGVLNLVMGKGSVVGDVIVKSPDVQRDHLHRLGRDRQEDRRGLGRAYAQVPARDGRQESARRPRRRRPQDRGRVRRQRRLFLDRPALHRLVAPGRDRGHPRQVRRCADRAAQGPGRRRRAEGRDAYRPGGRPEPARPGRGATSRSARRRARSSRWGGERLNRATPGFYLQPALFTDTRPEMRINREEIFGPVASVIRVKDYDEALRGRQRHAVRPVLRHLSRRA